MKMAERSCWTCLRFSECDRVRSKGRKYRLWAAPHRFSEFYRQTADNCQGYTQDSVVTAQIVANELLNRVAQAIRQGKVVALNDGTGSFSFRGEYDNESHAQASINGDRNILLLKVVSNHNPHPQ
ncbi:MAG: hypothetical protein PHE52_02250 [Candidatus Pacebacteria bacterium]|nr:hypothetical protein [Candidatus Paceibacterota bacterium]